MMSIRQIIGRIVAPALTLALCLASLPGCAPPAAQAAPEAETDRRLVATQASLNPHMMLSGRLEAVESTPILVPRTNAWQLPVRWMIEDGAEVQAGDVILQLDNSQFTGDLEQKRLVESSAYNDWLGRQATVAGELAEKEFARERARIGLEKARLDAEIPRNLRPLREYQEAQLTQSKAEVSHAKALEDLKTSREASESEIEELRLTLERTREEIVIAEEAIQRLTVRAPISGIVIVAEHVREGRKYQVGDTVHVGLELLQMPDLSRIKIAARLSDVDDGRVAVSARITSTLDAYPDRIFTGRVTDVAPIAGEENPQSLRRSFQVSVLLDETDPGQMRPGMSARVDVQLPEVQGVAVSRRAIDFGHRPARLRMADGEWREIDLGVCDSMRCLIADGVEVGERLGEAL